MQNDCQKINLQKIQEHETFDVKFFIFIEEINVHQYKTK